MKTSVLELTDCTFSEFGHYKFRDVSLEVSPRTVVAFLGEGKEELLMFLNRRKRWWIGGQFSGDYKLQGEPVVLKNRLKVPRPGSLPFVDKNQKLFSGMVQDNLFWGSKLMGSEADQTRIHRQQILELVMLPHSRRSTKVCELTKVEKRKLIVARALALKPVVLLVGDMISDLDPLERAEVEQLILSVASAYQVIIATENLRFIGRVSDKVAIFDSNRLVEFGESYQIFHNPVHEVTKRLLGENQ